MLLMRGLAWLFIARRMVNERFGPAFQDYDV
jgi:hypothetical protein